VSVAVIDPFRQEDESNDRDKSALIREAIEWLPKAKKKQEVSLVLRTDSIQDLSMSFLSSKHVALSPRREASMSPQMVRTSSWLLPIAAVISLIGTALQFLIPGPLGFDGPPSTVVSIVDILTGLLFIGGLLAAYQAHPKQLGLIGLIGLILLCLAALLFEIVLSVVAMGMDNHVASLSAQPPALFVVGGTALQFLGCILFGIRVIQTRVFPRGIGWTLIVVALLVVVNFALPETAGEIVNNLGSVLLFLAFGWLGYLVAMQLADAVTSPISQTTEAE
jgi:hypothetical protein